MGENNKPLIGVIDAGTRTVKFCVFESQNRKEIVEHAIDITPICPTEGWCEENPIEILDAVKSCMQEVCNKLGGRVKDIVAVGITNQRETTILWDKETGAPLYNAIVWNDIRTDHEVDKILSRVPEKNKNYFKPVCGLPISPYFSAFKIRWLIKHVEDVKDAIKENRCLFGTVDSWILWNLTGGKRNGIHATDVTNASRTFLMNIDTLNWDPMLIRTLQVPQEILPEIRSSSEIYGYISDKYPLSKVPISGIMGNQQSALVGQHCFQVGQAKNTYRSGCFLIYNTGKKKIMSSHGLITTVAYKFGKSKPVYALEGSVAVAGAALNWLRDNMRFMNDTSETESLAQSVWNTGDVYFVPAFKGLYAPYWRKDARGIICGLTAYSTKEHIIRAALEAICFQTRDILESMSKDCGTAIAKLHVDGVLTTNDLLMQLQADISGIPVIRAHSQDITALGVAIAAGQAECVNVWDLSAEMSTGPDNVQSDTFLPTTSHDERDARYSKWKMAVQRSLGWAVRRKKIPMTEQRYRLLASIPGSLYLIFSFSLLVLSKYK